MLAFENVGVRVRNCENLQEIEIFGPGRNSGPKKVKLSGGREMRHSAFRSMSVATCRLRMREECLNLPT